MTELEAKEIVAMLAAAYSNWKPSEETLELYEAVLRPVDGEAGKRAVMEIIRSPREFAPPVGLIYTRGCEIEREWREADRLREYEERQKRLRIEYPPMRALNSALLGGWFNPGHRLFLPETEEGRRNIRLLLEKIEPKGEEG